MFAQCRQKRTICGIASVGETVTGSETMKRTIAGGAANAGKFNDTEKCTWVLRSKTKAPTFVISNTTAAKQLPATVDVVYQEWIDGWQLTAGTDFLVASSTQGGGVPIHGMAAATYAKAFKFNYPGASMTGSPWEAAATNAAQSAGEAWVYQSYGKGCVPKATAGADVDSAGTAAANCFADKTAKRWISLDVSGATYLNAVKDKYDGALGTFNSAAASYNTYLADLKTANEKDAFSAFFSPPKKPAMVQRPGAPTTPATYAGLAHWPVASQQAMLKSTLSAPTTDGLQYVLGNNAAGGWGAWTISRFTNKPLGTQTAEDLVTNKLSHSFGMLGLSQGTTAMTGMSYVKQWQADLTTGAYTTALLKASFTGATSEGGVMCTAASSSTATHACLLNKTTNTAADPNSKYAYLNVSVWANAAIADGGYAADLDFYIQFYASAWAGGKAYYAPAAAAAGTALSSPAGAQALAASAAAVVAVAAALY